MIDSQQCEMTTKAGGRCRGRVLPGQTYCTMHSPQAIEGRRLGGEHRSNVERAARRLPPDLRQIVDMLSEGIEDVRSGALPASRLTAMAAGASAVVRVVEVALLQAELETLRGQVAELTTQRALE